MTIGGEVVCGVQKTGQMCLSDFLLVDGVGLKESIGVWGIVALGGGA